MHRPRIALILSLLLSCSFASAQAPAKATPKAASPKAAATTDMTARMDEVVRYFADDDLFSGSVAVARDGKTLFSKSYGYANPEWKVANTPDTRFRIGSLTKQFTAAAILILEERGQLKVEDPLKKYFPNIPESWNGITIHHLLTHTSGIETYTRARRAWPYYQPFDVNKLIEFEGPTPLLFQPGTDYLYDNSGYYLLGGIIEKVSGQTYEKFLQENIFTPLDMKDSGYDHLETFIPRRAMGYDRRGMHEYGNSSYVDMSVPFAAGSLYSTADDLTKWEHALYNGDVFSHTELEKMTTGYSKKVAKQDWGYDYGYGIMVDVVKGRKVYHHTGGINGFASVLYYLPDEKLSIAIVTNMLPSKHTATADNLVALLHGEPVKQPKPVPVNAKTLEQYVGDYGTADKPPMKITLDHGRLVARMGNRPPVYLVSQSDSKFYDKSNNTDIVFARAAAGPASEMAVVASDGKETKHPRLTLAARGLAGSWKAELKTHEGSRYSRFTFSDVKDGSFNVTLQGVDVPNAPVLRFEPGRMEGNQISFELKSKPKDPKEKPEVVASYTGFLDGDQLRLMYHILGKRPAGREPLDHGNLLAMTATREESQTTGQ